ncbi:MAG: zinc-ribbon domain-containing protein [Gemmatimonadota bacterium]|nr:zinc-ribbon domain-containing protein [Gemmatimonadota bacterium]
MNVTCPECSSVFRVDPTKIPRSGVRARCSVCGGVIGIGASGAIGDDFAAFGDVRPARAASAPAAMATAQAPAAVPPWRTAMPSSTSTSTGTRAPTPVQPAPAPFPQARTAPAPSAAPPRQSGGFQRPSDSAATDELDALIAGSGGAGSPIAIPPAGDLEWPELEGEAAPAPRAEPTPPFQAARRAPPSSSVNPPAAPAFRAASPPPAPAPPPSAAPSSPSTVSRATPLRAPAIAPSPAGERPPARAPINPFLANDPNQKAKRLARALVSDIIAYFPQKHKEAVRNGTLKEYFREEIKKSYEEYADQMGKEFAESTTHFQDALNDVLAGGKRVF